MWPLLLDMTKDESVQNLRNLELEAYSHLVSALRAQGPLNSDKRKLLKETSSVLNISQERHKAEIRRALSDEKLNTICYQVNNHNEFSEEWAQEGRRSVSLVPRMSPQTGYSVIADELSEAANQSNKLPLSTSSDRKRIAVSHPNQILNDGKSNMFKLPDGSKHDDSKKRKLSICPENSTLAQHLLGTPKITRIQQIYKQKVKIKPKDQIEKSKSDDDESSQDSITPHLPNQILIPKHAQTFKITTGSVVPSTSSQKINLISSVNLQPANVQEISELNSEQKANDLPLTLSQNIVSHPMDNNRDKILTTLKSNNNITFKTLSGAVTTPVDLNKVVKMCPSRKITKTVRTATGQKLIVVSNTQTIPTSSLHRTLTLPFVKNISVRNFDKFKIVTTTVTTTNITTTVVNSSTLNSAKHKVVTVKTNPTGAKKIFPVTQLQVLKKGNIKVLPFGGKILGKATTSTTSSPVYIMNSVGSLQTLTKTTTAVPIVTTTKESAVIENHQIESESPNKCNNLVEESQPSVEDNNKNIYNEAVEMKNEVTDINVGITEDYDAKIDEFHIQTIPVVECAAVIEKDKVEDNKEKVKQVNSIVVENECNSLEEAISDQPQQDSETISEPNVFVTEEVKVGYVNEHQVSEESDNLIKSNFFPQQADNFMNLKIDYQSN